MLFLAGCEYDEESLQVTVSAYTSSGRETDSTPYLAAWGDTLDPSVKSIAVSRDLIEMGLDHNQEVNIEGFEDTFIVLDKMHKRWTKKVDIYMGNDVDKALEWGKQEVIIYWKNEE